MRRVAGPTARRESAPRCGRAASAAVPAGWPGCCTRSASPTAIGGGGRARRSPTHARPPRPISSRATSPPRPPDRRWLGDITYVATWEGWRYLAVLPAAHSRRVVGRAMADHLRADLALDALAMALAARRSDAGLIHHTDRGCQYTAAAYRGALAARDITVSMSRATAPTMRWRSASSRP